MLQYIDDKLVYVVDFDTMPELPITGLGPMMKAYADSLTQAIETGVVTEPGKYAIHIHHDLGRWFWTIFRVNE